MKKIYKFTALMLFIIFVFCSCSADNKKTAYILGEAKVTTDIYSYYIDYVISNSDKKPSRDKVISKASALCEEYVKVNTKFNDLKLSLTAQQKASIAADVNSYWSMFGDYYQEIGVSKSTLTKIYESSIYKEVLLYKYYDTNGINPVSEDTVKNYFTSNYIVFKVITGYLTNDNKDSITAKFNSMAGSITSDNTIDAVSKAYQTEIGAQASDTIDISVLDKKSSSYPNGFFEKVSTMDYGKPQVITLEDYIFIVQRINGFDESSNYYKDYRSDCLKAVTSKQFSKLLESWYKSLTPKDKTGTEKSCYKTVNKIKEEYKQS